MKKAGFFLILLSAVLSTQHMYAQDSLKIYRPKPVSAEDFIGDKRQFFQIMVNKVISEKKKTGFLSITSYAAGYQNDISNNEYLNTTLIYHHLFKGISLNSGASFTSFEGLKSFVGLQYMYQNKILSLIYMPGYYFLHAHKISNFALIEYKPAISGKWSVYTRLQLHYNYDLEKGNHYRSYAYSRLGLSYGNFSFGLADNFDRYGAAKNTKNNYGVFLKLNL